MWKVAQISACQGDWVVGARLAGAWDFLESTFGSTGDVVAVWDAGLLVGQGTHPGFLHASVAAGVGLARITRKQASGDGLTTSHLGIPLEAQLSLRPTSVIGLNLYGYGDINNGKSFWG